MDVQRVPKLAFHHNGVTHDYGETFHKDFILHFINRKLYPVVLLKTKEDIDNFVNTEKEWNENTPFYKSKYFPFGEYFEQFRKVTRVVAFVKDKADFKEELKQLEKTAYDLSSREDLRVAKVTNSKIVADYKKKYNLEWFSSVSSNSLVMFKHDHNRSEVPPKFYDLNTDTQLFNEWISDNSIQALEEVSGFSFKIISHIKKPMFMAFIDRKHPEYAEESLQLYHILEEIAPNYPQYIFTYTEEDRYRATKKGKIII